MKLRFYLSVSPPPPLVLLQTWSSMSPGCLRCRPPTTWTTTVAPSRGRGPAPWWGRRATRRRAKTSNPPAALHTALKTASHSLLTHFKKIKSNLAAFYFSPPPPPPLRSTPIKHSDHTLRRGSNAVGRKQHTSPAFQPPLPPVEAPGGPAPQPPAQWAGPDAAQQSLAQSLAALVAAQQLLAQHTEELR